MLSRSDTRARIAQVERQIRHLNETVEQMKARLRREEQERFVLVQFNGHAKTYCYEVEEPCQEGDYCIVWSPMTCREEIVRVVGLGRGHWQHGTKMAKRIVYATTTDAQHHRFRTPVDGCNFSDDDIPF